MNTRIITLLFALTISNIQYAVASSALVEVDWSSLNVLIIDINPLDNELPIFTWTNESSITDNGAMSMYPLTYLSNYDSADDWTTALGSTLSTPNAQSSAIRDPNIVHSSSYVQNSGPGDYTDYNTASSYVYTAANFKLTGQGVAIISVNWNIDVAGTQNDRQNYSSATISLGASYENIADNQYLGLTIKNFELTRESYSGGNYNFNNSFDFAVVNTKADSEVNGGFEATTRTFSRGPAYVPLPAAAWSFCLGLMCLLGIKKRSINVRA